MTIIVRFSLLGLLCLGVLSTAYAQEQTVTHESIRSTLIPTHQVIFDRAIEIIKPYALYLTSEQSYDVARKYKQFIFRPGFPDRFKPIIIAVARVLEYQTLTNNQTYNIIDTEQTQDIPNTQQTQNTPNTQQTQNTSNTQQTQNTSNTQQTQNTSNTQQTQDASNDRQDDMIHAINTKRMSESYLPLSLNPTLSTIAQTYAQTLSDYNHFDHTGPDGSTVGQRVSQGGYTRQAVGENIAMGQTTVGQVMEDRMNSPGHRANILSPLFTEVGVGRVGNYWVQVFGKQQ